ncbi:MAG: hypothetical protein Fur0035_04580 [Anaerolineales bacterium]
MKRPTLILLILLLLTGGLYWLLSQPSSPIRAQLAGSPTPAATPDFLVGPLAPAFAKIQIEASGGQRLTLLSAGQNWTLKINSAEILPADSGRAESAAGGLRNIHILRRLESGSNPADFGLDQPVHSVSVLYADGSELHFRLGQATVIGSGYYAQLSDGSIVILDSAGIEELLRLLDNPPYLFTPTPSASATPEASATPAP